MRRTQISRLVDLPREFGIEKYKCPPDANIWYWVSMLEARVLRLFLWNRTDRDHFRSEIQAGALYLLQDPQWPAHSWPTKDSSGLTKYVHATHVRDHNAIEWFVGKLNTEDERFEKYADAWEKVEQPNGMELYPDSLRLLDTPIWQAYADAGISTDSIVSVEVDLSGSEEKIVNDFRTWLRSTQTALGIALPKKRVQTSDMESWSKYQLLAYLDLKLWSQAFDQEITQNLLGLALFPNEYEVSLADRIIKVVAPLALSVANEHFTDMLRSQALEAESKGEKSIPDKFSSVRVADDGKWLYVPDQDK